MKTAALVVLLALCVLAKEDKARESKKVLLHPELEAKEEDNAKEIKPDLTKRGLLHSDPLSSAVDLGHAIGSTSTLGAVGLGATVGESVIGGGLTDDSVIVNGSPGFGGGAVVGSTFGGGIIGDSSIGAGVFGGGLIGGHSLCSPGVIHGGSQHISLGNSFLHQQAIQPAPVVRTLKVERPVPVPVPQPFHVHVDRPVPVPHNVPEPYKVNVPKPYAVPVEKAVQYEVIKRVPIEVEKRIPYTVNKFVPYPVERRIPYPVQVPVDRPHHVHVPKPFPVVLTRRVPYLVDKQVSHPVKVNVEVPVPHPVPYDVPKPYTVRVPHPVPVHVDRPYAVHVPKPVPVHVTQHVTVPVPHPVPISVIKPVPVPVHESVHVPIPVSHRGLPSVQIVSKPQLGSGVHTDFSSLLLSHASTLGSDIVGDQGSFINHAPLTLGETNPFATGDVFAQGITPTALPAAVSTPATIIGGSGIQGTTITSQPLISANNVQFAGNGFSFGTKFGNSQSALLSSGVGAHGSFDLTPTDIDQFFPSSTVKPDFSFGSESKLGSDPHGFNVPLTVKVSRSSDASEKKSETPKPSPSDVAKIKA